MKITYNRQRKNQIRLKNIDKEKLRIGDLSTLKATGVMNKSQIRYEDRVSKSRIVCFVAVACAGKLGQAKNSSFQKPRVVVA